MKKNSILVGWTISSMFLVGCSTSNIKIDTSKDEKIEQNEQEEALKEKENKIKEGLALYKEGDFKTSNKYYSKAMLLANENSSEYRLAKSRVVNV